jgi:phosphoglycerate dehydrogenase-like enzyme
MNKIKSVGIIGLGNVGITLSKYILNEIEHNLELS